MLEMVLPLLMVTLPKSLLLFRTELLPLFPVRLLASLTLLGGQTPPLFHHLLTQVIPSLGRQVMPLLASGRIGPTRAPNQKQGQGYQEMAKRNRHGQTERD